MLVEYLSKVLGLAGLIAVSTSISSAQACGQGMSRSVDLYVAKMPTAQVLGYVAERAGLTFVASETAGDIRGTRLSGSVSSVLTRVSQRNGLVWWCEAGVIRVTSAASRKTCVIQDSRVGRDALMQSSAALGIDTRRVNFGPSNGGIYLVSGPSELMGHVTSAARGIAARPGRGGVIVYRGGQANMDLRPVTEAQDPVSCS
jgi:type II secretory pathway component GspD/PulD (secretin)